MIDMHIHSTYSDGTCSLREILQKAEELKLKYISITDHDNCLAYSELKNMDVAKYYSGKIIPGIELKCGYNGRTMDLLGYNIDTDKMTRFMSDFYKVKQRKDLQIKYFNLLYSACESLGLEMTPKDKIEWNPENDWASVVIYNDFKKHNTNKEKLPEDLWSDFTTFTKKYCSDFNSPFYIDKTQDCLSLAEGIRAIKECGGIAIIAHVFIYKWAKDKKALIDDIAKNYNIDGFECYHSNFSEEEIQYILNYCRINRLLMSGGSDFHGKNKPDIDLARGKGNLNINEVIIANWANRNIKKTEIRDKVNERSLDD